MIRLSALLALVFAVVLGVGEVLRNWGDWQPWPFWIVDFIAAGALVWGGRRALQLGSSRLLSAAWGFTVGIFWMSFFSHAERLNAAVDASTSTGIFGAGQLTLIIAAMLLTAVGGLVMSLAR